MKMHLNLVTTFCVLFSVFNVQARSMNSGGMDGGGGELASARVLEASEIRSILENVQLPVAAFFKFLSFGLEHNKSNPNAKSLATKLYQGPQRNAVIKKVLSVRPTLLETGECKSSEGDLHEAYTSTNPDHVCFSLDRLSKRKLLNVQNARTYLVALAAHEYSHLAGATEDEARFVQAEVLRLFSDRAFMYVHQEFGAKGNFDLILEFIKGTRQLAMARSPISEVCVNAGMMIGSVHFGLSGLTNPAMSGVSYLSEFEFGQISTTMKNLSQLLGFCKLNNEQGTLTHGDYNSFIRQLNEIERAMTLVSEAFR